MAKDLSDPGFFLQQSPTSKVHQSPTSKVVFCFLLGASCVRLFLGSFQKNKKCQYAGPQDICLVAAFFLVLKRGSLFEQYGVEQMFQQEISSTLVYLIRFELVCKRVQARFLCWLR